MDTSAAKSSSPPGADRSGIQNGSPGPSSLCRGGPQHYLVPMEVEKPPLALGESADVNDLLRLDAHSLKGRPVGDRGPREVAGILEADEAPVEQVIDAGRQQQSILPI